VIYEVTFKVKPLGIVHFGYALHDLDTLNQEQVDEVLATHQATDEYWKAFAGDTRRRGHLELYPSILH